MKNIVYIVHQGARDDYQVAQALLERGGLRVVLITSGYPLNHWVSILKILPFKMAKKMLGRRRDFLNSAEIYSDIIYESIAKMLGRLFGENLYLDLVDKRMVKRFFQAFNPEECLAIICYNYNAFRIFHDNRLIDFRKILFMCHPHPIYCKEVLLNYIKMGLVPPNLQEKEFSYSNDYFARLISEPCLASEIICASSLTKNSLLKFLPSTTQISVIPYGSSATINYKAPIEHKSHGPLKVIFVGQFSYRKGINNIESIINGCKNPLNVNIVGRGIREYTPSEKNIQPIHKLTINWDVTQKELNEMYNSADVFIFPTLLEGFGLVVLEAMRAGCVPVVSSMCCAHDVIRNKTDGFIIEPDDIFGFSAALDLLAENRNVLTTMKNSSFLRAEHLSWQDFRAGVSNII